MRSLSLSKVLYLVGRQTALFGSYVLIYFLLNPDLARRLNTAFIGGVRADPGLYYWLVAIGASRVLSWHSIGFNIPIFYPFGKALGFTDNFLLPAAIAKGAFAVGASDQLSLNLTYLAAFGLNGYVTYLLAYRLCRDRAGAYLAGLIFMSCPFLASQIGHSQLEFAFIIPAMFLALWSYFETQSAGAALGFGAAVLAGFLSSVTYVVFGLLLCVLLFLWQLRHRSFRPSFKALLRAVLINIPALVVFMVVAREHIIVKRVFGGRQIDDLVPFSATILAFVSASGRSTVWGDLTSGWTHAEAMLSVGAVSIILTLYLYIAAVSRAAVQQSLKRQMLISVWRGFFIGCVIALVFGAYQSLHYEAAKYTYDSFYLYPTWVLLLTAFYLGFWQKSRTSDSTEGLAPLLGFFAVFFTVAAFGLYNGENNGLVGPPSLALLLYKVFPGFSIVRATSRLGIVTVLCFCLLAAFAVRSLRRTELLRKRRVVQAAILAALFSGAALEGWNHDFPFHDPLPRAGVYAALDAIGVKRDGELKRVEAVVGFPFGIAGGMFALMQTEFMFGVFPPKFGPATSANDQRFVVDGYSGLVPWIHQGLTSLSFPDRQRLSLLRRVIGVQYLVYNSGWYPPANPQAVEERIKETGEEVKLIAADESGNRLYEFHPKISLGPVEVYAPSFIKDLELHFDVCRAAESKSETRGSVKLSGAGIDDENKGWTLIKRIDKPAPGVCVHQQVPLPAVVKRVKPQRLVFSATKPASDDRLTIENIELYSRAL